VRGPRIGLAFGDQLLGNTVVSGQVESLRGHKGYLSVGSLMWYLARVASSWA